MTHCALVPSVLVAFLVTDKERFKEGRVIPAQVQRDTVRCGREGLAAVHSPVAVEV